MFSATQILILFFSQRWNGPEELKITHSKVKAPLNFKSWLTAALCQSVAPHSFKQWRQPGERNVGSLSWILTLQASWQILFFFPYSKTTCPLHREEKNPLYLNNDWTWFMHEERMVWGEKEVNADSEIQQHGLKREEMNWDHHLLWFEGHCE